MLQEIILGLIFGFSVCLPPGPINLLIIGLSVRALALAIAVGLGAACCDTALMLGFGFFSAQLNPAFNDVLGICGAAIIAYMAVGILRAPIVRVDASAPQISRAALGKCFAKGFAINALNPYVITFWLGVAPQFAASPHPIVYAISICGACFAWIFMLAFGFARFADRISERWLRAISVISGLALLAFAVKMLLQTSYVQKFLGL